MLEGSTRMRMGCTALTFVLVVAYMMGYDDLMMQNLLFGGLSARKGVSDHQVTIPTHESDLESHKQHTDNTVDQELTVDNARSCPLVIDQIEKDQCYVDRVSKSCGCGKNGKDVLYEIPSRENAMTLTQDELINEVLFMFVHVNKAGGQTIKSIMMDAIEKGQWDGAGFGTVSGWKNLNHLRRLLLEPSDCPKKRQKTCHLRGVWGSLSMGLCDHFNDQPCIYFLTLRDPIERAISEYNYFCVNGAEHQKKWRPEWKEAGACPLTIVEYFEQNVTARNFLIERITRGCGGSCGIDVAKRNLEHKCLRYLLLDHFAEDAERFGNLVGGALSKAFQHAIDHDKKKNTLELSQRTETQLAQKQTMDRLRELLADDLEVYRYAVKLSNMKWKQPLVSCNAK